MTCARQHTGAFVFPSRHYHGLTVAFDLDIIKQSLPDEIKDELHAMCGAFTQEVGGIFMLVFDDAGNLKIQTRALEDDLLFDDIGCGLKVKKLQNEKKELFQSLELFYKIFIQGVDINSLVNE